MNTVSITCAIDHRSHEVADAEFDAGIAQQSGCYQALCGHMVAAAAMAMPDGSRCWRCAELRELARAADRRSPRRRRDVGR